MYFLEEDDEIVAIRSVDRLDTWYIFRTDRTQIRVIVSLKDRRITSCSYNLTKAEAKYILDRLKIYDNDEANK